MRDFDLQVKVISDFERQELLTRGDEGSKIDEQAYLKIVGAKVEADLINIREVFEIGKESVKEEKKKKEDLNLSKEVKEVDFREYFEKWLNVIKDML
jgi:hypothetical protein